MRFTKAMVVWLLLAVWGPAGDKAPRMPMPIEFQNSAEFGWLNKKVLEARLLDDVTDPATWSFEGQGEMTFPGESASVSIRHLRVRVDINPPEAARPTGRGLPAVAVKRTFPGEDWSGYNRLSFWMRPELSGFNILPMLVVMRNDGQEKVPDVYRREGQHYVTLQNHKWQHVVWEITPLARDKVTSVEFHYWVNKRLPDASDSVVFDLGRLELERVDPDHFEGWNVAPGRISFSHTGYQLGSSKSAIAGDLAARDFQLIRLDNNAQGEIVLSRPVRTRKTRFGQFQEMDFSEVRLPGSYVLQAGDIRTRPFRIDSNVWRGTIWKAINFFYGERCGFAIPGLHDVCHRDWQATLGDKKIVMNGGWHDAGDLSQGLVNTGEAAYAMFALAERLQARDEDPVLLRRLIEEATWGLDWVLKVRFEGGYRIGFAGMNIWTNGILGDADDRTREALNNPNVNYIAAAAEAIAYRVLKHSDPELAARSLRLAEDDWKYAIAGKEGPETWSTPAFAASDIELAGIGILASLELYQDTGKQQYADKSVELARIVVDSQQKSYVGREFPLAGFFYTGPGKETIFHQFHRGNDQAPIVAMARLCQAFPNHPDWMKWYAVVALYAEYQKSGARTTEPYGVLPSYVYRDNEYLQVPENDRYQSNREAYRQQVLNGMPMGDGYYLKAFPVWFARRGNFGPLLSQAKALSVAAHLRGDWAAAELAQKQLQWIVGRNPFVQSTMYGEGYDWTQQYSVSTGDIVGALPVGIQTRGNSDLPYWPAQNCYVYKEVWVRSTGRWFWLMQDLAGPALVEGRVRPGAGKPVVFEDTRTAGMHALEPDPVRGVFRAFLSEGNYKVRHNGRQTTVTLLPGGSYYLDLRPGHVLDFSITAEKAVNGEVAIRLTASGDGRHTFAVRAENLAVDQPVRELTLRPGTAAGLVWKARMVSPGAPWVLVVVPDDDVSRRRELVGDKALRAEY